ncbi:hypothetical protein CO614_08170 [Lysobacteraceae bacterium NML120232]|nr:hypothetical protein CO608_04880 [Xanthomonadaceae bacterium NML08-0793]PJK10757.1 hypothetical protein CO614_08170 [Xanthomonadaceae bacterium NML120232]
MDELLNEHEQGERVRSWLQRNASGLIGGVAVGLALVWGWHWWQDKRDADRDAEAMAYDSFQQQLAAGPEAVAKAYATVPKGTPYQAMAALDLAKTQVDADKLDEAIATLRGIDVKDPALKPVVDSRIARLLVDTGKPEEAVKLLGQSDDAEALEIIGDAQFALGKQDAARDAYQKALRSLEEGSPARQLVEIKLAQVGADAPAAADTPAEPAGAKTETAAAAG